MNRLSLKMKLTLLYSFFMMCITCVVMGVLLSISNREIRGLVGANLQNRVVKSIEDIEVEDGELDIDSDFYSLDHNIYLSLYTTDAFFLYGKIPYDFTSIPPFLDRKLQVIPQKEEKWYVYDVLCELDGYGQVYVRGVTSLTDSENNFHITLRIAMILFPLFAVFTAVIGYRFTSRTLLPVRKILDTVQRIQRDADLSCRIGLEEHKGKKGDEIYNLAETFDQMLDQLEKAFQREKQFTSDVSHELRTPISVILAQCNDCLANDTMPEEQRMKITLIERKAREMSEMISQLLLLSRADQGRYQLNRERMNVSELTEIIAEEQQWLAEEKKIEIIKEIEPNLFACVDETFYIRMLVNLLSNAIAYGKLGGKIWIHLEAKGDRIQGCVQDDGIGIAEEELEHIWKRFYRADISRTKTDGENHSGLGLSMVKWIVEAHGGNVWVQSSLGEGSQFYFEIPTNFNDSLMFGDYS